MSAPWRRWADVPPARAWAPADPAGFKLADARHLLRRAAFGAAPGEAERLVVNGLDAAVAGLLAGDAAEVRERYEVFERLGRQAAAGDSVVPVRRWWLYVMNHSGHALREKMTLFWHWHFATGADKVGSPARMFRQNCTFRRHALGKFGPILTEVARDPAMLVWLDGNSNTKAHANENFAREVMELFTLGVGRYTETDVREAARAFTGFHLDEAADEFRFNAEEHDPGEKAVLGKTGRLVGDDVLAHLLAQPACAAFVAGKVARYFLSDDAIPESLIEPLADTFRRSGYDISQLVGTILRSELFFAPICRRARVKTPVEFAAGAARSLFGEVFEFVNFTDPLASMGMALLAPPDVKGWRGGRAWLSHAALVERLGFAEKLAMGFSATSLADYDVRSKSSRPLDGNGAPVPDASRVSATKGPDGLERVGIDFSPAKAAAAEVSTTSADAPTAREELKKPKAKAPDREALGKPSQARVKVKLVTPQFPEFDVLKDVPLGSIPDAVAWLDRMAERLFDAPLPSVARQKLVAHLAEADGHPPWLAQRCREALHAMLSMPEYQLN